MIAALALILTCQLVGDVIARLTGLPLPAPVLGMVLLFVYLVVRRRLVPPDAGARPDPLEASCETLLQHMALMFVPAGVGVVQRLDVLGQNLVGLAVIVVVTTAISITVTALTFKYVDRWMSPSTPEAGS